jgi:type IV secretory pathway VirB2 component (pilin)
MKKFNSLKHSRAAQTLVGLTNKKNIRTALPKAPPVLLFFAFASLAHADPVTAFFAGIQATALAVASSIAVIGIILAAAFHIFGTGRMAETMEKVGVGCFLLGGAGAIAAWLFGL